MKSMKNLVPGGCEIVDQNEVDPGGANLAPTLLTLLRPKVPEWLRKVLFIKEKSFWKKKEVVKTETVAVDPNVHQAFFASSEERHAFMETLSKIREEIDSNNEVSRDFFDNLLNEGTGHNP